VKERRAAPPALPALPIVYQDDAIIVIDKPVNLLTIATENEKHQTAYRILSDALAERNQEKSIFVVHRLDRETSGLLIFARNLPAKEHLQAQFREQTATRRYIAIVEGRLINERATLTHMLAENSQHQVYVARRANEGKPAILHYQVMRELGGYSQLEITLQTGRRGQIRAQLAAIGHPILGERGSRHNPINRLALHAHYLAVTHPLKETRQEFHSPLPAAFQRLK
jgi:23S rRNA pseudouridine1911/1915/1917 synthase